MRNVLHQAILLIHQRRDFAGHAIHRPSNWVDCRRVIQLKLGIHLTGADGLGGGFDLPHIAPQRAQPQIHRNGEQENGDGQKSQIKQLQLLEKIRVIHRSYRE